VRIPDVHGMGRSQKTCSNSIGICWQTAAESDLPAAYLRLRRCLPRNAMLPYGKEFSILLYDEP